MAAVRLHQRNPPAHELIRRHSVHDESIKLFHIPENDSIALCVYNENDGLLQLGERINARFEDAYMNGYNWDVLIRCYMAKIDPDLMAEVQTDPEAGSWSAYISNSPENLERMNRLESQIRSMVADEDALMKFIEDHWDEIEWD
jgi:hypothetical protein